MSSVSDKYTCFHCSHQPFDSKVKLSKHVSNYHRKVDTIRVGDNVYPLIQGNGNNSLVCPNCNIECSNIANLRRHLKKRCRASCGLDAAATLVDGHTGGANPTDELNDREPDGLGDGGERQRTAESSPVDCTSLEGLGLIYDEDWNVLICKRCSHIVDSSMMTQHITKVHKLAIQNIQTMWT
ncbi:hypothetical protein V1508DRAFT_140458, partial [Lipomyces doorenjongii]|uniref:uncharacterized protein n=1 Tax=Lipomyces doorenjongii TaxID=383834 RepID=UPI0034CEDB1F